MPRPCSSVTPLGPCSRWREGVRSEMSETDGFDATPEQEGLRASVRSFARREFAPTYLTRAQSTEFPWKALRSLSELGLLQLLCPPEHGGPDEPAYVASGIAVEELAYADFNIANVLIP